jgi:transcriptional regulator with XRE-family HTH domain
MSYCTWVKKMKFERIKNLREDKDIKQRELAEYLNVSQNTYSQYENGVISLNAETLVKLAKFYDTSIDYLLGLTDERRPYKRK